MRILVSILLSVAIGFATYVVGAVLWTIADPLGAGSSLLFTIPVAVVGMAVPALIGALAMINHCRWDTRELVRRRLKRPKPARPIPPRSAADGLELQLAA